MSTVQDAIYWEKFRDLQKKAATQGLWCGECDERRTLGKDVTPEVALKAYRCKTCRKLCRFRPTPKNK